MCSTPRAVVVAFVAATSFRLLLLRGAAIIPSLSIVTQLTSLARSKKGEREKRMLLIEAKQSSEFWPEAGEAAELREREERAAAEDELCSRADSIRPPVRSLLQGRERTAKSKDEKGEMRKFKFVPVRYSEFGPRTGRFGNYWERRATSTRRLKCSGLFRYKQIQEGGKEE